MVIYNVLSLIGVCFDIIGAIFISRPIITKDTLELVIESTGCQNIKDKKNQFSRLWKERTSNRLGVVLLIIGFTLQAISYVLQILK